jgi:hypothetical protein
MVAERAALDLQRPSAAEADPALSDARAPAEDLLRGRVPDRAAATHVIAQLEDELRRLCAVIDVEARARAAGMFGITPKTVDTYKNRIGQKLGFTHRTDYVRFALRVRLIGDDDGRSAHENAHHLAHGSQVLSRCSSPVRQSHGSPATRRVRRS